MKPSPNNPQRPGSIKYTGSRHGASDLRFRADQHFLQNAAKQLFAPEVAFGPRISDQADALRDQILLGSYYKSIKYGRPISDRIRQELKFMNEKQL